MEVHTVVLVQLSFCWSSGLTQVVSDALRSARTRVVKPSPHTDEHELHVVQSFTAHRRTVVDVEPVDPVVLLVVVELRPVVLVRGAVVVVVVVLELVVVVLVVDVEGTDLAR